MPDSLQLLDLHVDAGETPILRGVSLEVRRGQVVGLIGESGSGKTVTCRAIANVLPKTMSVHAGRLLVGGAEVPLSRRRRVSAERIGMVFADPHASLDPLHRIGNQIAEVARVQRGLDRRQARAVTISLLESVAIDDSVRVADSFPFELSGGQAQRAMIASVLAGDPEFIFADEPTSALDASIRAEILDLLARLVGEKEIGLVLTTHDMSAVQRIADEVNVMYAGRVVESGPTQLVLDHAEHPYTSLLVQSRPRQVKGSDRLTAIPGEPPDLAHLSRGCAFWPRCPKGEPICQLEDPPRCEYGNGAGMAECHLVTVAVERP